MKKKSKHLANILFNTFIFIILIGSALAVSYLFGLFFALGFLITIYNKDIKKKTGKIFFIFIGALLARIALGNFLSLISNIEITLDFIVAILMFIFLFSLGWKIKKS